jgi:hypothetical protein
MESFIGLYNTECIRPAPFVKGTLKTVNDVDYATTAWVDWFSTRQQYCSLGNVPTAEFDAAHYEPITAPQLEAQPDQDGRKALRVLENNPLVQLDPRLPHPGRGRKPHYTAFIHEGYPA